MNGHGIFLWIVFSVFLLTAIIQLFYYLYFYLRAGMPVKKAAAETNACRGPVSVIICARNEAENLRKNLPRVLEQDYPDFEVIVVNDCSTDDTETVLYEFTGKYARLRVSRIEENPQFTHYKKFALFIGIKASKNDILLFTDADCKPLSDQWIAEMTAPFSDDGTSFVLGYGGYEKKKGLLNKIIRYDTVMIALQYLGMALRGNPYMGVGRNLAYRRQLFFDNKGFSTHNHVISGDDDLFVNGLATGNNTKVEYRHEAHTVSSAPSAFSEWFRQKKRHYTTAALYKLSHRIILFLEPFTRELFYASLIVLLAFDFLPIPVIIIFGLRLTCQTIVFHLAKKRLKEKGLVLFSIFFDVFSPFIHGIIYLSNYFNRHKHYQWK